MVNPRENIWTHWTPRPKKRERVTSCILVSITNTLQKHLQKYLHHHFLPRAPPWTSFLDLTSRRADILALFSFLHDVCVSYRLNVLPHLFVVFKASSFSFLSPSAGARDDDFDCAHESRSSKRSLGSILKRLHACLMMSAQIFIFTCRGVYALPLPNEKKRVLFCSNFWW